MNSHDKSCLRGTDKKQAFQSQKMAGVLKYKILEVEGKKDADKLHVYCIAELRLCFYKMQKACCIMMRLTYTFKKSLYVHPAVY